MKMFVKILFIFVLIITAELKLSAQDPQFSQFYAATTYLCPSFAGSTDGSRAILNYRNQWPSVPGAFVSTALSIDQYFPKVRSGVGFIFVNDKAGSGNLKNTNFGVQYAYNLSINRLWSVRPAMQVMYSQRSIDFNKLVFGDQLSFSGNATNSIVETLTTDQTGYIDFSTSAIVFSDKIWGGIAFDHLLEPNQSLTGSISNVPLKTSIFGGTKLFLKKSAGLYEEEYINVTFIYKHQDKFDQLDIGGYWFRKPLLVGIWYRGIPLAKSYKPEYINNDAFSIMAGIKYKQLVVGYSYDFTISRLISSTGGAHEFSIIYEFNQDQHLMKKRKKVIVPCPKV